MAGPGHVAARPRRPAGRGYRPGRCHPHLPVDPVPLVARPVAVDLDAVPVGILQVERLADQVVALAGEREAEAQPVPEPATKVGPRGQQDGEVVEAGVAGPVARPGSARPCCSVGAGAGVPATPRVAALPVPVEECEAEGARCRRRASDRGRRRSGRGVPPGLPGRSPPPLSVPCSWSSESLRRVIAECCCHPHYLTRQYLTCQVPAR